MTAVVEGLAVVLGAVCGSLVVSSAATKSPSLNIWLLYGHKPHTLNPLTEFSIVQVML